MKYTYTWYIPGIYLVYDILPGRKVPCGHVSIRYVDTIYQVYIGNISGLKMSYDDIKRKPAMYELKNYSRFTFYVVI